MDLFDGHCDTILRCYQSGCGFRSNEGQLDLLRTRKYRRYAQFFAIFGEPEDMPGKLLWQVFQEEYLLFSREMERNRDLISFCRTAEEAEAAFDGGRSAAFLSAEGAELLDCDLEKLEQAFRMGVRAVNLTWNHPNLLSGTHVEDPDRGLSPQGRAFVRRMQELGMLVDVSHLSDRGFWDVMEITAAPVVATHSNSRAVFFDTRNLTDAQFTAIMKCNGVVGLNMYDGFLGPGADLDTLIAHLEHFLSLGGAGHVALGGDWDGGIRPPRGIRGIQDMDLLGQALLRRNYPEQLVQDIFYTNLMRVVSKVCNM